MRSFVLAAAILTFLVLAALSLPSHASSYVGEHYRVEFTQEKCESVTALLLLVQAGVDSPLKAVIHVDGAVEPLLACYGVLDDEDYLVVTEEGRGGTIPRVAVQNSSL